MLQCAAVNTTSECLKCRTSGEDHGMFSPLAVQLCLISRIDPPGAMIAVFLLERLLRIESGKGKNVSEAITAPF